MTKDEYERLRLAARATAARSLMLWAAALLRGSFPCEADLRAQCRSAMERRISLLRADNLQLTFPELPAAMSDLWAAELQEALDSLSQEFLDEIARP